jgi:hypothetical protein
MADNPNGAASPSVRLSRSKDYRTIYSNTFRVLMGGSEISIVFGYQTEIPGIEGNVIIDEVGLVVTPTTLKVLHLAIQDYVEVIEHISGRAIEVPKPTLDALAETKAKTMDELKKAAGEITKDEAAN